MEPKLIDIISLLDNMSKAYKWFRKRKGNIFEVAINGEERIIKIKEPIEETGNYFIRAKDLKNGQEFTFAIKDIKSLKELSAEDVKRKLGKNIDLLKAIDFIKDLTTTEGGVLSHKDYSVPLPGPSAQSLIALYNAQNLFGDIMPEDEFLLRIKYLTSLEGFSDWGNNEFNCFVASNCVWALGEVFDDVQKDTFKKGIIRLIKKAGQEILLNFNEKEGGWSWCKEAEPTYPYYTFYALKAFQIIKDLTKKIEIDKDILEEIDLKVNQGVQYLKKYLNKGIDPGQQSMCLWGLYEFDRQIISDEKYLSNIYKGIEKMESKPINTKPQKFFIQFFMPKAVIPLLLVAPESEYTIKAVIRVIKWIRETQNEGWGWESTAGQDASWATSWVLRIINAIVSNPKSLQAIFSYIKE